MQKARLGTPLASFRWSAGDFTESVTDMRLMTAITLVLASANCGFAREPQKAPIQPEASHNSKAVAERERFGGSFQGTLAYDSDVHYDFGQFDDNAETAEQRRSRHKPFQQKRQALENDKVPDPGDYDFADFYYTGFLYNDRSLNDYEDPSGTLGYDQAMGRRQYYSEERYLPPDYGDYRAYRRFRYELSLE
jgi:hypothetical protein